MNAVAKIDEKAAELEMEAPAQPAVAPVTEPPPEATAKVTVTPGRALPLTSWTRTAGGVLTGVPAGAVWLLPIC